MNFLVAACMWDLVPRPGIELWSPALGAWGLSHWTTGEVPRRIVLVDEKLISQFKKELETFIRAKFEDYNLGRASQEALRTVPPVRSQDTVYI